jgi:hypothetical protein
LPRSWSARQISVPWSTSLGHALYSILDT